MLIPIDRLLNRPVMSLQTGGELARTSELIIDPRQLTIAAIYVVGKLLDHSPSILHTADIRELGPLGCIVNDSSALMPPDDLVRLQEIIDFDFRLIGIRVEDEDGRKLGKVQSATFEPTTYTIQQIITEQSWLQSIMESSHVIHRSQIIAVTNQKIVVHSAETKDQAPARKRLTTPLSGTAA